MALSLFSPKISLASSPLNVETPVEYRGLGKLTRLDSTGYNFTITTRIEKHPLGIQITETKNKVADGADKTWGDTTVFKELGDTGFYVGVDDKGTPDSAHWAYCGKDQCHFEYVGPGPKGIDDAAVIRNFEETWTFKKHHIAKIGSKRTKDQWSKWTIDQDVTPVKN